MFFSDVLSNTLHGVKTTTDVGLLSKILILPSAIPLPQPFISRLHIDKPTHTALYDYRDLLKTPNDLAPAIVYTHPLMLFAAPTFPFHCRQPLSIPGPRMRQPRLLSVGADGGGYTSLVYQLR